MEEERNDVLEEIHAEATDVIGGLVLAETWLTGGWDGTLEKTTHVMPRLAGAVSAARQAMERILELAGDGRQKLREGTIMEQQSREGERGKTVYSVLAEIENQLKLIRRVTYDHFLEDDIDTERRDEVLGVHNTLQDIEMKIAMLIKGDELEAIKAPAALQIW
ncbi:MAG TPA: hypothetical protein PKJ17_03760 [Syntrophorhabdaceae bacterium]|nr:hypothetical protein [Syntrophorhabdaceae bacterium]